MRLYTTTGATRVDDPTYGTFVAGNEGAFDFPNELSDRLHGVHVNKKALWENDDERVKRVNEEQLKSVRDPAALYSAVKEMSDTQRGLSIGQSVLLAAVVKALGIDVPGAESAATPAAPTPATPPPVVATPVAKVAEPVEATPDDEIESESDADSEPAEDAPAPAKADEPAADTATTEAKLPAAKASAKPAAKDSADVSTPGEAAASEPKTARARKTTAASSK